MPIVTTAGFSPAKATPFVGLEAFDDGAHATALDLPNDAAVEALAPRLDAIDVIRIPFPSFADGRGFSLARRLRDLGYRGRLRAAGHVVSDQFAYALECGFDEIEIDDALAARQPEADWLAEARLAPGVSYRDKLAGRR